MFLSHSLFVITEVLASSYNLPICCGLPQLRTIQLKESYDPKVFMTKTIEQEGLESAFCVVSLSSIVSRVRHWNDIVPRIQPVFSVGCNPDEGVLRILHHCGVALSTSCASDIKHVAKVTGLGCSSSCISVMDTMVRRGGKYAKQALASGISTFVVDSAAGMSRLNIEEKDISVLIKLRCSDDCEGVTLKELDAIMTTSATDIVSKVTGVVLSINKTNYDSSFYGMLKMLLDALNTASEAFSTAASRGVNFFRIHLSGSFVDNMNINHGEDDKLAFALNSAISSLFPADKFPHLTISAEAADSLVGNSCAIATVICGVKHGVEESMYYVDDGIYGSFHSNMIGAHSGIKLRPRPLSEVTHSDQTMPSTIWGPTCDSLDVLGKGIPLPKMEVGNWLYITECGSFSVANGTSFNGVAAPEIRYVWCLADLMV